MISPKICLTAASLLCLLSSTTTTFVSATTLVDEASHRSGAVRPHHSNKEHSHSGTHQREVNNHDRRHHHHHHHHHKHAKHEHQDKSKAETSPHDKKPDHPDHPEKKLTKPAHHAQPPSTPIHSPKHNKTATAPSKPKHQPVLDPVQEKPSPDKSPRRHEKPSTHPPSPPTKKAGHQKLAPHVHPRKHNEKSGSQSLPPTKEPTVQKPKKGDSPRSGDVQAPGNVSITAPGTPEVITTLTGPFSGGHVTSYDAPDSGGACLLSPRPDRYFAAMDIDMWDSSAYCGMCINVTTHPAGPGQVNLPSRSVVVQITNQMPDRGAGGSFDLSHEAFLELAPLVIGRIPITWVPVDCKKVGLESGNPTLVWKKGSSVHWFGVQVQHSALPLASVSIKASGTVDAPWQKLVRSQWNFWLAENGYQGGQPGPFDVQVTYQDNSVIVLKNVALNGQISAW